MQDNNRHIETLHALAAGTDSVTGKYSLQIAHTTSRNHKGAILALNELKVVAEKATRV